jgi:glycosyltransferase involved in cell wall biosynthesis
MAPTTTVYLGPSIDLHVGVHGSLVDSPPTRVRYQLVDARHVFLFPASAPARSPHLAAHWGELVEFPRCDGVAHSTRWPVIHHPAWVVDTDDLGIVLLGGRYAAHPTFADALRDASTKPMPDDIRRRCDNLLVAYAHPSCGAILCRSRTVAEATRRWIDSLCSPPTADVLLDKLRIVYPAQRPCGEEHIRHKWRSDARLQVVFCGRHFESKNGDVALRIFASLAREFPAVSFVYIGKVPAAEQREHASALGGRICYLEEPRRDRVLAELRESHVLFHPSQFESVGIVFFEAAAAGLAVVTATGGAMAHVGELFDQAGARLLDRDRVAPADEPLAFEQHLRACLRHPEITRGMAIWNYERSRTGPFSLARRDATLAQAYGAVTARRVAPLTVDVLPHVHGAELVRWRSQDVDRDRRAASGIIGPPDRRFLVTSH